MNKLPTNYTDQKYDKRLYEVTAVGNNEVLVHDVTEYTEDGSRYVADDMNSRNRLVNQLIDNAEDTKTKVDTIVNGSKAIDVVQRAETTPYATTCDEADTVTSTPLAETALVVESLENDFILATNKSLSFSNNKCTITDSRITANSLADVYFTKATMEDARKSVPIVQTYDGKLEITLGRTPKSTLVASIKIRKVD